MLKEQAFAAYTIRIAETLSEQLTRFATLNAHQLAGHVQNLDFWTDEVAHCLTVIDEYHTRFNRLAAGQGAYVKAHETISFALDDPCCILGPAARPKRIPDTQRLQARRDLCDAYYRFLVRCYRAGVVELPALRAQCDRLDISIDPQDIRDAR